MKPRSMDVSKMEQYGGADMMPSRGDMGMMERPMRHPPAMRKAMKSDAAMDRSMTGKAGKTKKRHEPSRALSYF